MGELVMLFGLTVDVCGVLCVARILRNATNWQWPAAIDSVGSPVTDYVEERADDIAGLFGQSLPASMRPLAAFFLLYSLRIAAGVIFHAIS